VLGDVGGGEAWSGGFHAADVGALDVEAVAEEAEHLFDVFLEGADDVLSEEAGVSAVFADHAADGLGLVKEEADLANDGALAAEVDGALPAVFSPNEAVVGAETATAVVSPGGGNCALVGEACGIFAEERDGFVVARGSVHAFSISIWRDFSMEELDKWGVFWWGWGGHCTSRYPQRIQEDSDEERGGCGV
jgi:hypothetical protein